MKKILLLLIAFPLAVTLSAATFNYTVVKDTKLPNGNHLVGVHYTDTYGNDETVIVLVTNDVFKDDKKLAKATNKEVWKVAATRHYRKHSIKNDPIFNTKKKQRTILFQKKDGKQ